MRNASTHPGEPVRNYWERLFGLPPSELALDLFARCARHFGAKDPLLHICAYLIYLIDTDVGSVEREVLKNGPSAAVLVRDLVRDLESTRNRLRHASEMMNQTAHVYGTMASAAERAERDAEAAEARAKAAGAHKRYSVVRRGTIALVGQIVAALVVGTVWNFLEGPMPFGSELQQCSTEARREYHSWTGGLGKNTASDLYAGRTSDG